MVRARMSPLVFVSTIFVTSTVLPAQSSPQTVNDLYRVVSGDIAAAARQVSSDVYDYRPTKDVRSFGQIVAHLAGSQFLYCAQAGRSRFDNELIARLEPVRRYAEAPNTAPAAMSPGKEQLVALLDDGIAYCRGVYDRTPDAGGPLLENVAHNNLHYGNLITYLRMNGIVPPSTERLTR